MNNDDANLYTGFAGVMLYGDQTIALFIESPHQPGVSNLVGLGNGKIDPRSQGVDGLDFLKNLSFTNFAPSGTHLVVLNGASAQTASFSFVGATSNRFQNLQLSNSAGVVGTCLTLSGLYSSNGPAGMNATSMP